MGKYNIALCISGEPRNTISSFPYIFESFLQQNPICKVDVFIHTRKPYRAINLYQPKSLIIDEEPERIIYNKVTSSLNITSLKAKTKYEVFNNFTFNSNMFKNVILMYDGIQKCFKNASSIKSYDLYIRCRPDLIFRSKFSLRHIMYDILLEKKYDMFIPNSFPGNENMDDDKLAIGNYKSIKSYMNVLPNLNYLINQTNDLVSEKWLQSQLKSDQINVNKHFIDVDIIRKCKLSLQWGNNNFYNED